MKPFVVNFIMTYPQVVTSRRQSTVQCLAMSQTHKATSGSEKERLCWSTGLTRMAGGMVQPAALRAGSLDPMSRYGSMSVITTICHSLAQFYCDPQVL